MLVARMILRRSAGPQRAVLILGGQRAVRTEARRAPFLRPAGSTACWTRRISAIPGRKTSTWPACGRSSRTSRTTGATALGTGRTRRAGDTPGRRETTAPRPRTTGQSSRNRATGSGVERRRHHHDDQIGSNVPPDFSQQGQGQVGVQAPFVELVEHHGADRLEERIGQKLPGEDALGLDPQPGSRRDPPLEPDLVADLLAQRPALLLGDPGRGGPRRDPSRLQHDHPRVLLREQARPHQRRRHTRRLARSRRRNQYQPPVLPEAWPGSRAGSGQSAARSSTGLCRGHCPPCVLGCRFLSAKACRVRQLAMMHRSASRCYLLRPWMQVPVRQSFKASSATRSIDNKHRSVYYLESDELHQHVCLHSRLAS